MAEGRIMPSLYVMLDPIIDAHVIKAVPSVSIVGTGGWETRLLSLLLYDGVDGFKILSHLFCTIIVVEEIGNALGIARPRLFQVDGLESEEPNQAMDRFVVAIDEFATPFGDHSRCPGRCIGMHTTAYALSHFVHV